MEGKEKNSKNAIKHSNKKICHKMREKYMKKIENNGNHYSIDKQYK
jgi:hypothetical protein